MPVMPGNSLRQRQHGVAVGNIELAEGESLVRRQPRQPRLLQRDIVIVVEIVDAEHRVAARQKRLRHLRPDKAGGAGDQDHGMPDHAPASARPTLT